jgi:hypothetical protein
MSRLSRSPMPTFASPGFVVKARAELCSITGDELEPG